MQLLVISDTNNRLKNFFSKSRKSDPGYSLRKVALHADDDDDKDDWSEYNLFADEQTYGDEDEHIADNEKFNNLRQERLNKRKEDLHKLLDLINNKDDKEKVAKFLDEIITLD